MVHNLDSSEDVSLSQFHGMVSPVTGTWLSLCINSTYCVCIVCQVGKNSVAGLKRLSSVLSKERLSSVLVPIYLLVNSTLVKPKCSPTGGFKCD